ncbi:MAG: 5'-3' exonuclease H3TH domain-containing protein [Blautia producta]
MFLIIDGSSMLSSSYYGNLPKQILFAKTEEERAKHYNKIMHAPDGTYTNGIFTMLRTVLKILKNQTPDHIAFVFDKTRNTFRRELYADYKGTRGETPAPLKQQFALAEEMFQEMGFPVFFSDQYEADDFAGSITEKFWQQDSIVLMTKDVDYLQLVSDERNVRAWMVQVSQEKADKLFAAYQVDKKRTNLPDKVFEFTETYIQGEYGLSSGNMVIDWKALAGDSSDNIPGVKGISDKSSIPLLNEYQTVEALYEALEEEGSGIEDFWKEFLGLRKGSYKKLTAPGAKESALLSKQLATIRLDIPIAAELSDFTCIPNREGFLKIVERFGFQSLKDEL